MSNYRNFVQDFAGRCRDVLTAYLEPARLRDREVTLLLMATTSGLVLPYERVSDEQGFPQPPLDRERYADAKARLDQLTAEPMAESALFQDQESWCGGPLRFAKGTPDEWPELQPPTPLAPETPTLEIIRPLRHSVAHGNVLTRSGARGQIAELVFVSGGYASVPLRYLLVAPKDLARFLDCWLAEVVNLPVPYGEAMQAIGETVAA